MKKKNITNLRLKKTIISSLTIRGGVFIDADGTQVATCMTSVNTECPNTDANNCPTRAKHGCVESQDICESDERVCPQ
ncbi:hypothetical protein [Kordia sp.]|uniref:hypothetical protein n=1 Tax=Kordia sp. TaxID=1965332 RepID=UPI003B58DEC6